MMGDDSKPRTLGGVKRSKGATPSSKGKAPSSARYDLGVPGLVAQCIEDLYRSTGTRAVPPDRLFPLAVVTGVLTGLVLGYEPGKYEPGEILYGPIGAVLGVVFGFLGGVSVGAIFRWGLMSWLRPEAKALQLVRTGRIRSASRVFRRARWWIVSDRSAALRIAGLALNLLGLGRADLPPDIAHANLDACEGILAESVGDSQAAADAYLNALDHWPRHGFALISLLDLVIREGMPELAEAVEARTEQFVETARDKTLERAAREYLTLLKHVPEPPAEPPIYRVKEEQVEYTRDPAAGVPPPGGIKTVISCKLIENPGSQISNGMLVVRGPSKEKTIKLPPMPFQLMMNLAEAMCGAEVEGEPAQMGWVSINDLLAKLPWTTPNVTNSNVHKLVYKLRNHLAQNDVERAFIEENLNGCYRISLPPESIEIERVATA